MSRKRKKSKQLGGLWQCLSWNISTSRNIRLGIESSKPIILHSEYNPDQSQIRQSYHQVSNPTWRRAFPKVYSEMGFGPREVVEMEQVIAAFDI